MNIRTDKLNCYIEGIRIPLMHFQTTTSQNELSTGLVVVPLGTVVNARAFANAFVQVTYLYDTREVLLYEGLCTKVLLEEEHFTITLYLTSLYSCFNFNTTLDYVSPKKYGLKKLDEGVLIWLGTEDSTTVSNSELESGAHLSDRHVFLYDEDATITPNDPESNKLFYVLNRYPFADRLAFVFFEDIQYANFWLSKAYIDRFNLLAKAKGKRVQIAQREAEQSFIDTIGYEVRVDAERSGIERVLQDRDQVSKQGCTADYEPAGTYGEPPSGVTISKNAINFQDYVANDPRRVYVGGRDMSPRQEQWCTKETAEALLKAGQLIHNKYKVQLVVGDISMLSNGQMITFGPHKEHKEGHVCDLYIDGATNIYASNYDYNKVIDIANMFHSCGAVSIGFKDPKNWSKIESGTRIKMRNLSSHETHWHVRFFY